MEIRRKTSKQSVDTIVKYIKNKSYDSAINKLSYLNGIYGVFYGVAILYELTEEEQINWLTALQEACDDPETVNT